MTQSQDQDDEQQRSAPDSARRHPSVIAARWGAVGVLGAAAITGVIQVIGGGGGGQAPPTNSPAVSSPAVERSGPSLSVAAPSTPVVAPSTPVPVPTAGSPVRREESGVVIARTYGIDLDATREESPDWRYGNGVSADDHDFYYWYTGPVSASSLVVASAPDKASCQRTGYDTGVSAQQVTDGTVICVKTNHGRYARVTIRKVDPVQSNMTVDITVWN